MTSEKASELEHAQITLKVAWGGRAVQTYFLAMVI